MDENETRDPNQKEFGRPWEEDPTESDEDSEDIDAEVVPLPGIDTQDASEADEDEAPDFEGFAASDYTTYSTQEYEGLAEDVARANTEEWEQQAVSAPMAGVNTGMVGFDDVANTERMVMEDHEEIAQAAASDFTMRVASAFVVFGLFFGSLLLGGWWFASFVILVMVVAVGELYATLRTIDYRPVALFGLLGVVLMGVGAAQVGPLAIGGWAAAVTVVTVLFFSLAPRRHPLENTTTTILGMVWVGMLSFTILIAQSANPVALILFAVFLIAFNDMGAYFVGRSFGKRPLAPGVSPNKTVEGFFGGLLASLVVASILTTFPAWESIGLGRGLALAAVVGLFGPLGDLIESMLKRSIGVKDMGSVLPGHGGMLDRIDSFLLAVPALYLALRGFGIL